MRIIPEQTHGLIECMLSAFIFYSPNFLYFFPFFKDKVYLLLLYNYFAMFLLISAVANYRFNRRYINPKVTPEDMKIFKKL